MARDRIFERHFTTHRHVGEQKRREHFANRADLEDRVARERTIVGFVVLPGRNGPSSTRLKDTSDKADASLAQREVIDALSQNALKSLIRRNSGPSFSCKRLRAPSKDA